MTTRTATCCCEQLSLSVEGDPSRVSICHCLACQKRTGSTYGVQAMFTPDQVKVTGDATCYVRTGDEGSKASFHFCPVCGSTVYYENNAIPGHIMIAVGAFADPNFPTPLVSVYEERKHHWVEVPAELTHIF